MPTRASPPCPGPAAAADPHRARALAWRAVRHVPVILAVVALALALAGAAHAAASTRQLGVNSQEAGSLLVVYFAPRGSSVEFFERVGSERVPVGHAVAEPYDAALLPIRPHWRCDRLVRTFEARAVEPDGAVTSGSYSLRTPSCRDRLDLVAPRRTRPGRRVAVTVADTWNLGTEATLCIRRPGARPECDRVATGTTRRFRATRRGLWQMTLRYRGFVTRHELAVGVRARTRSLPVLLTTGDSTIQGIESYLADRLSGRARVRRDFFAGTGITPPHSQWQAIARRQSTTDAKVAVISIGANDLYPMTTPEGVEVACCDEPWVAEYARRAARMMATYAERGKRVIWLALPAPRDGDRAPGSAAVNAAVARAAAANAAVRHVRIDEVISPGFVYRERIVVNGRKVRVRQADGIHLTPAGTRIAAGMVLDAIRRWRGAL